MLGFDEAGNGGAFRNAGTVLELEKRYSGAWVLGREDVAAMLTLGHIHLDAVDRHTFFGEEYAHASRIGERFGPIEFHNQILPT